MDVSFPLDDERIQELEDLAALGYTPQEMALYFDVDPLYFLQACAQEDSKIHYHIKRGQLMAVAKEQMAFLGDAQKGAVTASQQLGKIRRTRGWEISKLDIFGGFDTKSKIDQLQNYIESGSLNDLSTEEAIYLEALTLFHSMFRKYGRRKCIAFFTKKPWNLKHSRASEMLDEALNLFYIDRNIERKALRQLYAEELNEAAMVVRQNALSAKDWEIFGKLKTQAAKLLQLDQPDPEKLPADIYMKPLRIYTLDTEQIGLPAINRQEVASQIEALEIPERDKIRVRQDARLQSFNLEEKLNELEKEGKGK